MVAESPADSPLNSMLQRAFPQFSAVPAPLHESFPLQTKSVSLAIAESTATSPHEATPKQLISNRRSMGPLTTALPQALCPHSTVQSKSGGQINAESVHESAASHCRTQGRALLHLHSAPMPEQLTYWGSTGERVGTLLGDALGATEGAVGGRVGLFVGRGVIGLGTPFDSEQNPKQLKPEAPPIFATASSQPVADAHSRVHCPSPHWNELALQESTPSQSKRKSVAPLPSIRASLHTVSPRQ